MIPELVYVASACLFITEENMDSPSSRRAREPSAIGTRNPYTTRISAGRRRAQTARYALGLSACLSDDSRPRFFVAQRCLTSSDGKHIGRIPSAAVGISDTAQNPARGFGCYRIYRQLTVQHGAGAPSFNVASACFARSAQRVQSAIGALRLSMFFLMFSTSSMLMFASI